MKSALNRIVVIYVHLHIMPITQKVGIMPPQNWKIKKNNSQKYKNIQLLKLCAR